MKNSPSKSAKIAPMDPRHPEHKAYIEWLRNLSMEERGQMLARLCQEAADEERARIAAGLPPTEPEPWPESTWEHLRRWAAQSRETANDSASACANE
jgi:hypothetical protein